MTSRYGEASREVMNVIAERVGRWRAAPVFFAAAASYTANCALGASVVLRRAETPRRRSLHHALYVVTLALSAGAVSSPLWTASSAASRRAAAVLAPAAAPLVAMPFAGTGTRLHPVIALTAAPFFIASVAWAARGG